MSGGGDTSWTSPPRGASPGRNGARGGPGQGPRPAAFLRAEPGSGAEPEKSRWTGAAAGLVGQSLTCVPVNWRKGGMKCSPSPILTLILRRGQQSFSSFQFMPSRMAQPSFFPPKSNPHRGRAARGHARNPGRAVHPSLWLLPRRGGFLRGKSPPSLSPLSLGKVSDGYPCG